MRDLVSLAVLALIIFSKLLAVFLILVGLTLTMIFLFFAGMNNPELIGDFRWAEFWNRITFLYGLAVLGMTLLPTLVGVWLFKLPTLKLWPGPDVKDQVDDFC